MTAPATARRRGATPPSLRPVARPDERAARCRCAHCYAETPPLTQADALPSGWWCEPWGSGWRHVCPNCAPSRVGRQVARP